MGLSLTQRKSALDQARKGGMIEHTPLWRGDNGWSVVELVTLGCFWWEGNLMKNCLRLSTYEDPRVWALARDCTPRDFPLDLQFPNSPRNDDPLEWRAYYSLRDETGYPRAAFYLVQNRPENIRGHANSQPKATHLAVLDEAARQIGWNPIRAEYHEKAA